MILLKCARRWASPVTPNGKTTDYYDWGWYYYYYYYGNYDDWDNYFGNYDDWDNYGNYDDWDNYGNSDDWDSYFGNYDDWDNYYGNYDNGYYYGYNYGFPGNYYDLQPSCEDNCGDMVGYCYCDF